MFHIHQSGCWSIWMVERDPWVYGLSSRTARRTATRSVCTESHANQTCLAIVTSTRRALLVLPPAPVLWCTWLVFHTHPCQAYIAGLHIGNYQICSACSRWCRVSRASVSISFSRPKWSTSPFCTCACEERLFVQHLVQIVLSKSISKTEEWLEFSPRHVGYCTLPMASVAFADMPSPSVWIKWHK